MKVGYSRRQFLNISAGAAVSTGLLGTLGGARRAFAATSDTSGYKALVCLLLNGGNNGHNWVVPLSPAPYAQYVAARNSLALANSSLLPLNGTASNGYTYGIHPSCPELQTLYNSGKAAFVCNVGTIIQPTTKAQAQAASVALPPQLFAHLDQQTEWLTAVPQSLTHYGWGGQIADLFLAQGLKTNLAYNIDIGGTNYWQQGKDTNPYVLGTGSVPTLAAANNPYYRNGTRAQATLDLLSQAAQDPNLLVQEYAGILNTSAQKETYIGNALKSAGSISTPFPAAGENDSGLGAQLQQVANVIKAQSYIGDSRQMFFVQLNGFDTHNGELATQNQLLGYVSRYVNAFSQAMVDLNMQNNVTLFTVSDFGRTLTSNSDGSDHGWGNHHMVVGGAVQGGKLYGAMPDLTIGGADDFGQGRMIPSTSVDQHAATLARWFGVADSDLDSIFTNLKNFQTRNLGFLG